VSPEMAWGVLIVLALGYDMWAAMRRPGGTLSESVWRASLRRPVVPFLAGVLCGHLFWGGADCMALFK